MRKSSLSGSPRTRTGGFVEVGDDATAVGLQRHPGCAARSSPSAGQSGWPDTLGDPVVTNWLQ